MYNVKIFDVPILLNRDEINSVKSCCRTQKGVVNTINSNLLVNAFKNKSYLEVLKKSSFNICDGSVLVSALNLINKTNYKSYPGPDFFMDTIKEKKYKHAFLGSTKSVLENLKSQLVIIDNDIKDALFIELPFLEVSQFDYSGISKRINKVGPDFVWVSLGAPKQEEFSSLLIKEIDKGLIVSVGAAFDFYSLNSKVVRCPNWIQKLRLEWLYRLFKQPKKTFSRLKNEFVYMPIILIKEILKKA